MAETSNIDLISYTSTKIDSKASNSKAYTDKSCLFDNIFDKVNKAYSKEETTQNKVSSQDNPQQQNKNELKDTNTQSVNKNEDKEKKQTEDSSNQKAEEPNQNKTVEKPDEQPDEKTDKNLDSKTDAQKDQNKEKDLPKKNENSLDNESTTKLTTANDAEVKVDTNNIQITAQMATAAEFQANVNTSADATKDKKISVEASADVKIETNMNINSNSSKTEINSTAKIAISKEKEASVTTETDEADVHTNTESTSTMTATADINKCSFAGNAENVVELLALNPQSQDANYKISNQNENTIDINQPKQGNQTIQADFNADLISSTKALNSRKSVNVENTISIDENSQLEQQDNQNNQPSTQTKMSESDSNSPLIETETNVLASNKTLQTMTVDETKQLKETLEKASLTQEALNKVNAKVVSVETSSGSNLNTNLKNKQNTEDQVIKLSLESDSSKSVNTDATVDFANITTDSTTQTNFAKTVNVQAQAQTHPQTSKEISDTEILSQINNKLNNIKDEGTTKINIVLKPENLGKINLELVNTKEGLTAQLTTNNSQVKEILDKSLDSLKDTLGSQGVNVNSVSVKVEETQKQSNEFSFDQQMEQNNQQFSGNADNSNEQKFTLEEEIGMSGINSEENVSIETEIHSENSVSIKTGLGKIDYKV